jgi:hypothetical protein
VSSRQRGEVSTSGGCPAGGRAALFAGRREEQKTMTNDCIDVCNGVVAMLPDDGALTDSDDHEEILDALARRRPISETRTVVMSLERGTVTEAGGHLSLRANGTEIGRFCLEAGHSPPWSGRQTTRRGQTTRRRNAAVACHLTSSTRGCCLRTPPATGRKLAWAV